MKIRFWLCALSGLMACAMLARVGYAQTERGPAMVTIAGAIGKTNRGPVVKFTDAFFAHHEKTFPGAYVLDRAALLRLKQVSVTAHAVHWPRAHKFKGPLLRDVLALAEPKGKTIIPFALDGYGAEITVEMLDTQRWVLALEADGKPLGLGGRGPAWVVYDTTRTGPISEDEEAKWVWSVFFIEVQ